MAAIEPLNVGSEDYLIPGTEALNLHHLYRAMAFLGQEIESKGQKTLGRPRCLKDLIEEELFERRRDLFTEVDQTWRYHPLLLQKLQQLMQTLSAVRQFTVEPGAEYNRPRPLI